MLQSPDCQLLLYLDQLDLKQKIMNCLNFNILLLIKNFKLTLVNQ